MPAPEERSPSRQHSSGQDPRGGESVLAMWPPGRGGRQEAQPSPALLVGLSSGTLVIIVRRQMPVGSEFAMGGSGSRADARLYVAQSCEAEGSSGAFRVSAVPVPRRPSTGPSPDPRAQEVRRLFE